MPYPWNGNDRLTAADLNAAITARAAVAADYRYEAPTTGSTITLVSGDRILVVNPAATIAALTVALVAGTDKLTFRIATRQRIDALTITPSGGDAVDWTVNELPQNGRLFFMYVSGIGTWVQL